MSVLSIVSVIRDAIACTLFRRAAWITYSHTNPRPASRALELAVIDAQAVETAASGQTLSQNGPFARKCPR